jgi:NhaA family Na+:H+ antiporter
MSEPARFTRRLFSPLSRAETRRIADILRKETIGGALLLTGALIALVWANSPWSQAYTELTRYRLGPESLHLQLTLQQWAADGLLAIFFFVAGLELKREFVAGELRDPLRAVVPVAAACGGVAVPAGLYLLLTAGISDAAAGWAIPTATDIAFTLAVLAIIGRHLPATLRTFLLTLAVVDDLIAIVIIAVFYTRHLSVLALLAALLPLAVYTVLVQRQVRTRWVLLPLAALTWALVHASGVHATVAGVLLGLAVPVARGRGLAGGPDAGPGLAEQFEHRWRPISAGVAVPVFALLSAGVSVGGAGELAATLTDRIVLGIMIGLVVGKTIGITGATYLVARFSRANLAEGLTWVDVLGLAMLAGIGFTVSLLIGELAFGPSSKRDEEVKIAVLAGSLIAALLAAVVLRLRDRAHRRLQEAETAAASGERAVS